MKTKGMFAESSAGIKVLMGIGVFCLALVLGVLFSKVTAIAIEDKAMQLRLDQFFESAFLFIVAPLVCHYLFSDRNIEDKLGLRNRPTANVVVLVMLSMLFISPIIAVVSEINQAMVLPESLGWLEESLKGMENDAARLTKLLIATTNPFVILLNLIVIALIPAIGEELIFRVFIQGGLQKRWAVWSSIIVTSILFSAIHFQFYGFLPRFVLSIWLGVLFVWGRSTWLNSIAHFTNNALAILVFVLYKVASGEFPDVNEMEKMGSDIDISSLFVLALFVICVWQIRECTRNNTITTIDENDDNTLVIADDSNDNDGKR